jgi:hypothetical protein
MVNLGISLHGWWIKWDRSILYLREVLSVMG